MGVFCECQKFEFEFEFERMFVENMGKEYHGTIPS